MKVRQSKSAPVGVLSKVLSIFELLDRAPNGLQLRQIAEQAKINKSTAYRFLAHLEKEGYLLRDVSGAYLVGPRLVRLGSGSTFQATLCKVGRPVLESIWKESGETVNLGILEGKEILYIDVIESPHTFRLVSPVGMRRPLYCTGLGKVILAFLSAKQREELIATIQFERLTPQTFLRPADFRAELQRIQRRGYALDNEEAVPGARCVAAPIFDHTGFVVAGISLSGPTTRMSRTRITELGAIAKDAARTVSLQLGHTGETSL
jgi:IclR family KDG regulon transcriptional repressor